MRSKSKPMKVGNLYHKFIKGSDLEKQGMVAIDLAIILAKQRYIFVDFANDTYQENWKEKNWPMDWPNIYNIVDQDEEWKVKIEIRRLSCSG